MLNAPRVFSIDEIYERVWNEPSYNAENTVAVHIRKIREKIEINPSEPRYLKVVWELDIKLKSEIKLSLYAFVILLLFSFSFTNTLRLFDDFPERFKNSYFDTERFRREIEGIFLICLCLLS